MKSVILVVLLFGTYDSHCTHHFIVHDHAGACRGLRQCEARTSDSEISVTLRTLLTWSAYCRTIKGLRMCIGKIIGMLEYVWYCK